MSLQDRHSNAFGIVWLIRAPVVTIVEQIGWARWQPLDFENAGPNGSEYR